MKVLSDGTVNTTVLQNIYNTSTCYYCKTEIDRPLRTLEHILPLNKGGLHSSSNLTMACLSCNSSKRDLTEEEFIKILNERKQNERNKC